MAPRLGAAEKDAYMATAPAQISRIVRFNFSAGVPFRHNRRTIYTEKTTTPTHDPSMAYLLSVRFAHSRYIRIAARRRAVFSVNLAG